MRNATCKLSQRFEPLPLRQLRLRRFPGSRLGAKPSLKFKGEMAQRELAHSHCGEVAHRGDGLRDPDPRLRVDGTERPKHVPFGRREWHAEVGHNSKLRHREVVETSGCRRASSILSGAPVVTMCWQKEWESGVFRLVAQGSGNPCALLKNCWSASTRDTRAIGTSSNRRTSRVSRSKASSGGVSRSAVRRSASSRFRSCSTAERSASVLGRKSCSQRSQFATPPQTEARPMDGIPVPP